jgi:hypothetical protein
VGEFGDKRRVQITTHTMHWSLITAAAEAGKGIVDVAEQATTERKVASAEFRAGPTGVFNSMLRRSTARPNAACSVSRS